MSNVKWTDEQKQAIYEKNTNILVAAAAGSGKTAVLVERIINKIINDNVDIDKLLVVTFTNAAASEMKQRVLDAIYKKLNENPENENLQKQILLLNKAVPPNIGFGHYPFETSGRTGLGWHHACQPAIEAESLHFRL